MIVRAVCAGAMAAAGTIAAAAQPEPAPPAGYAADGYVDARGCAFRRARVGSAEVWAEVSGPDGAPHCEPPVAAPDTIPPHRGGRPPFADPGAYVQVALFRDAARADLYARQIAAAGLGVVAQDFARNGGRVQRVMYAGPVRTATEADAALGVVRALGFADAFVWPATP